MAVVEKLFVTDYGAPVAPADAGPALAAWLTEAATIVTAGNTPKLRMQGNTYNFPGVPNGPSYGLKRAIIDGEGATVNALFIGNGGPPQTFTDTARIGTIAAGATSATVIQGPYPNDVQISAAFLSIGQWIMIGGLSMQQGSYPVNFQYNEFRKITGIAGNVVSWAEPLVHEYKQTWPMCDTQPVTVSSASPAVVTMAGHGFSAGQEVYFSFGVGGSIPTGITRFARYQVFATGLTANTFQISSDGIAAVNTSSAGSGVILHTRPFDMSGPATIFGLQATFEGEHQYLNLNVSSVGEIFGGGSTSIILDNVDFAGKGPCPSATKSWIHRNSQVGSQNEVDKGVEYCEYNNCTGTGLAQLLFFSPGCMQMLITGCTLKTLNGTPLNLTVTNSSITETVSNFGFMAGTAAFGRTNSIAISNSTIASSMLAGVRVDLKAPYFTAWTFASGTFAVLLTNSATKNEALRCFVPGYKYIVGNGPGAGNTVPDGGGGPIIFTVTDIYQDATKLYIVTTLASATFPTFGGLPAEFFFSYGAKTIMQTASGPADVTQFAEQSRVFAIHLVAEVPPGFVGSAMLGGGLFPVAITGSGERDANVGGVMVNL